MRQCTICGASVLDILWIDEEPGGHYVVVYRPLDLQLSERQADNTMVFTASQVLVTKLCREVAAWPSPRS